MNDEPVGGEQVERILGRRRIPQDECDLIGLQQGIEALLGRRIDVVTFNVG